MINHTITALIELTRNLPVGTNLALLHFLWMLVTGALLPQRGALFPALQATGLSPEAVRRAWAAFRGGAWQISLLLQRWQAYLQRLPGWQVHRHQGYRMITADITAFWRPTLQDCPSRHYHPQARRALPAIILGLVGEVGDIAGQRLACPRAFERISTDDPSEKRLWRVLLRRLGQQLADDEVVVVDAGVKVRDLQAAQVARYVVRLAVNFTARRKQVAAYTGKGRPPRYGEIVRPLPRKYKKHTLPATPPDRVETWGEEENTFRAEIWEDLLLPGVLPSPEAPTFRVYAIHDPAYTTPWLLATPLVLQAATLTAIYHDRWPVEQLPLSAKQMLGAHRQFVHAAESVQRLPELALLAGSILSYLAATAPLTPTGFWDRHPKRTPGRLRRQLQGLPFPKDYLLPEQLRQKASVTAHLPKGVQAHRRQKRAHTPQNGP